MDKIGRKALLGKSLFIYVIYITYIDLLTVDHPDMEIRSTSLIYKLTFFDLAYKSVL